MQNTTIETDLAEVKQTILNLLHADPAFNTTGVLTAKIGERFKKADSKGRSLREIFPTTTVTQFLRDELADSVQLVKDPNNPIKIFARSLSAASDETQEAMLQRSSSKIPRKLFKLRAFLLALSDDEREKFSLNGSLLLSLMRDEL
jgi:hypothetical protein